MRLRKRYLPLAALLGAAVAVLPTIASSAVTATVNAESNTATCNYNCWSPAQVTVTSGDMVAFKNSSGVIHGVVWESSNPATPTCTNVPVNSSSTSFNGTCTFSQAGTYNFYCYVHGTSMSGTITANANGTTTTTTTGTTTTTTTPTTTSTTTTTPPPTTTTTTTPPPPQSTSTATQSSTTPSSSTTATTPVEPPPGSPLLRSPSLRSTQRGTSVKGSLNVSQAGGGGRLEVDLFAKSASLARTRRSGSGSVRVGRLVRASVSVGRVSFSVSLTARGKRALTRHRHLALTVKITLTPVRGTPVSVTRNVVLRA
jgi:plastocyanin